MTAPAHSGILLTGLSYAIPFATRDADGNLQDVDSATFTSTYLSIDGTVTTPTPTNVSTGRYTFPIDLTSASGGDEIIAEVTYAMDTVTTTVKIVGTVAVEGATTIYVDTSAAPATITACIDGGADDSGFTVYVYANSDKSGGLRGMTTTDGSGNYTVGVSGAGTYYVFYDKAGYGLQGPHTVTAV